MSNWRLANSLITLRNQLNGMFPARSKASDGAIGDQAHAARKSEHNPNAAGVVRAIDVTHDPKNGVDCHELAKALCTSKDNRVLYIIWNGRITVQGTNLQKWKPYPGKNAHTHHLHISVRAEAVFYDTAVKWNLDGLKADAPKLSLSTAGTSDASALLSARTNPSSDTVDAAENLPLDAGGENSAENSDGDGKTATETTKSETVETDKGEVRNEETQKNEQSVNDKVLIELPPPQGISAKLKAGIGTLFSGTFIYIVLERFGAMSFSMQSIILISVVCFFGLLGFMFWAFMDAWKSNNKITHERESKTAIDKKDLEWVAAK